MAPRSQDKLHTEVYQEVYTLLERKDDETLRFAPDGTAEQVLHADKLRRFFRSLLDSDQTALVQFNATEDELITRVKERRLQPFLAVLIIAGCSMTTARTVTTKLIANQPPSSRQGIVAGSLPIGQEDLCDIFNGDQVDTDKFLGKQAYFCPVVIRNRQETRIEDTNQRRLPYLEEQSLRKGSFGHVFRVKIAKGHFYDPVRKTVNPEPLEIARKDYELSSEFDAAGEREIMEQIFASSASTCPNILNNMGSLAFGPSVYSLFMPLAICDLRQYMMELHQARFNSIEERMEVLRCAIGLTGGLHFLHREMRTRDMAHLVCYHLDLKPSNILIFRETGTDGEISTIWKISDFGMSRMKTRHSQERVEKEKDVTSWFIRRSAPEDPSTAPTKNRRAEGTYLAPESVSPEPTMKTHSDVWSLGCVLSVVFTHMEEGREGLRKYTAERLRHDDGAGSDRFFVLSRGFRAAKLNPAIKKTHGDLVRRASSRSHEEGHLMKVALEFVENHVLQIDQRKRQDAKRVESMLEDTFKSYMKLLAGPGVAKPSRKPRGERIRHKVVTRISPKPTEMVHDTAETWCLSEVEAFKGCQISPDCSFVAYWTDRKILLYSKHSLNSTTSHDITSASQYTIDKEACFWNTLRLTDKYLVASTTSATFQCYIFDLRDGGLKILRVVDLPQPAISKLAISPKSRSLACVVRSSDDDRNPGSLLIFRLSEFLRRVSRRLDTRTVGEVAHQRCVLDELPDIYVDTWWKCPLEWRARNIARTLFSTEEDVYFVVRPELTVRKSRKRVYVVHVNISTKDLHFLPIEPLGLDSSTTARLFTTFSPFVSEAATCAVVTREKQLHIHNLIAGDLATPIRKDIKNYRIVKLLKESEDNRLYAVARQSANYRMMLVEMTVPRSNDDEVQTRELAHLPDLADDDQFIARLLNETNGKSVLIASVVGSGQRAIHRVGFEGHQ